MSAWESDLSGGCCHKPSLWPRAFTLNLSEQPLTYANNPSPPLYSSIQWSTKHLLFLNSPRPFPSPLHKRIQLQLNSNSNPLNLSSPSPLYSSSNPYSSYSLILYHRYHSLSLDTDLILLDLYKYTLNVPVNLILDIKIVSVLFSWLSHLSLILAALTNSPRLHSITKLTYAKSFSNPSHTNPQT